MEKQALYFGSLGNGHFMHREDHSYIHSRKLTEVAPNLPWSYEVIDCGLLENGKIPDRPTGQVHFTCGGNGEDCFWFAFYWWDRSADSRPGSNSGFYVRGFGRPVAETFDAIARIAFEYACAQWPEVVKRQQFPLVLVPAMPQAADGPAKLETDRGAAT